MLLRSRAVGRSHGRGRAVNDLKAACQNAVQDLQRVCLSRRMPKEEKDVVVMVMRNLRKAMRKDYDQQKLKGMLEWVERRMPHDYPFA